jgi:copper resistance protein B
MRFHASRLSRLTFAVIAFVVIPALVQRGLAQGHAGHPAATETMPGMTMPRPTPPPVRSPSAPAPAAIPAQAPPAGLGGSTSVGRPPVEASTEGWPKPVNDMTLNSFLLFDLLEFQLAPDVKAARWDVVGWYGSDSERLWFKSEGRYNGVTRGGDADAQVLYGRLISPFIDFQAGFRWEQQLSWDNQLGRAFGVVGIQGLAPFGMEVEAAAFVSQHGDVSARVTLAQDFLLTQRLILQPRFEMNAAVQSVPRYGVGSGVNDIELGLRLRYEIMREFAPYVGFSWLRSLGETATLRSNGGENTSAFQLVAGVRMWF